jgi:hypothetical protein
MVGAEGNEHLAEEYIANKLRAVYKDYITVWRDDPTKGVPWFADNQKGWYFPKARIDIELYPIVDIEDHNIKSDKDDILCIDTKGFSKTLKSLNKQHPDIKTRRQLWMVKNPEHKTIYEDWLKQYDEEVKFIDDYYEVLQDDNKNDKCIFVEVKTRPDYTIASFQRLGYKPYIPQDKASAIIDKLKAYPKSKAYYINPLKGNNEFICCVINDAVLNENTEDTSMNASRFHKEGKQGEKSIAVPQRLFAKLTNEWNFDKVFDDNDEPLDMYKAFEEEANTPDLSHVSKNHDEVPHPDLLPKPINTRAI